MNDDKQYVTQLEWVQGYRDVYQGKIEAMQDEISRLQACVAVLTTLLMKNRTITQEEIDSV